MSRLAVSALLFLSLLAVFAGAASARSLQQSVSGCSGSAVNAAIGKVGQQASSLVANGLASSWPSVSSQLTTQLAAVNLTQGDDPEAGINHTRCGCDIVTIMLVRLFQTNSLTAHYAHIPVPASAIPSGKPVSFKKCALQACIGFNATLAGSITISKGVLTGLSTPTATIKSVTCGPSSGLVRQHGLACINSAGGLSGMHQQRGNTAHSFTYDTMAVLPSIDLLR